MKIDVCDGRCRECGGILDVIEADDASMTVECERGHSYPVELDAFGDGCMLHVLAFLAERMERRES